ncbi:MAG: hypothetical protein ACRC9L_07165 [Brevinema sp.]
MRSINTFLFIILPIVCFGQSQKFSYLGFSLGMDDKTLMELAQNHPDLLLEKDMLLVQLIPNTPFTLSLVGRDDNIQKVLIDTFEKSSYQVTIFFNAKLFSFYTLSEKLMDKYGVPKTRSAYKVSWFDETQTRRLTLEYPATIKITDFPILQQVIESQNQQNQQGLLNSRDYQNRQRLLDEL